MSVNNTNVYSFKSASSQLNNYKIYGSDKYTANYKIYGNTEIPENLFDENSTWNIKSYINTNNAFPSESGGGRRTYFMNVAGSTTYKINMTSCGDRLKVVYYDTNIDPTTYTTSNKVTATGVIYGTGNGAIASGENLCMTFTTPSQAKMIGIYYSLNTLPTGFTITKVKNNYSVGNLVNLFDENSEVITGKYIDDNGVITQSGNGGVNTYDYIPVEPNTIYRAKSFGIGSGSLDIRVAYYDSSKTFISRVISNKNNTFTTPINCMYIRLSINRPKPIHDLQISLTKGDSDPATYEPHKYKVPIRVTGKNLLKVGTNQTINGVTFAVNSDGSVTCNGTASVNTFFHLKQFYLQKGSYIISGCPQNGSMSSYIITMRDGKTGNYYSGINGDDTGTGKTMITTEYLRFVCIIRIASGYTCDNLTFYPMIRRADIEDSTYEPYRESIENVYLDSPLTKSGDNCDYIDFKEQKRVNIDGTEEYLALPELKIESENDSIFIDTDTQPSNIDFDILHGVGDRTENLFDVTKITPGYWINHLTGVLTSTPNSDLSDYIPVSQGITYTLNWSQIGNLYSSSNREYVFFDSNKMIIPGGSVYNITQNNSCSITAPNGAAYIRFDYDKSFTDITLNEPFGYKIPIKVQGKNLFIKPVEQGSITAATGGYNSSNTTRIYSKNIPLIPGKTYTISCNNNLKFRLITLYFNDTYIGQLYLNDTSSTAESQTTITIPENANNISISFWNGNNSATVIPSDLEWCQIEEGETATEYEEPFNQITNIYLDEPLLKVGDNADYIDYSAQKKYTYNNTIESMMLPNIQVNAGENKLMIDTLIKPSNISISVLNANDGSIPVDTNNKNNKQEKIKHIFKTTEDTLRNYQIYGSNKYAANYRIYGNTEIPENLFDENSTWNINSCVDTDNTFPGLGSRTTYRTYFMNVAGSTTYKINMTSCGDRLKIVYYNTNIDPTTYTTSNKVTATGVIYSPNGSTGNGAITSGKNLCMAFTTPSQAKMIGIYYSLDTSPTGFTITKVKNNYSVGNLVNLFNENSEVITNTYIDDNGGLSTYNCDTYDYISVEPNTIYRAKSFGIGSGSLSIRVAYYDSSKTFISRVISNKNSTFTTPINCVYIRLSIDNTKPIHDLQISLTKGNSDPATYEPYGYKVPIRVTGKNLLKVGTNQTMSGVTFTVNLDGSVTCNGTASETAFYSNYLYFQKGSYIISGCPQNGGSSSYLASIRNSSDGTPAIGTGNDDKGNGINVNLPNGLTDVRYTIRIASGYTCDNLTFYPMIRRADIENSTYEPYEEQIEYLYLDSPLTKSGDNCDYIDFKEQKRVNIDGTEEYIKLPELKIESENDSIFIDTDIQPSNIDFDILHGVGDGEYSYNILPMSLTPKTETHGDFLCEYDGLGTIKLTTTKNNASTTTDFIIPLEKPITFPQSISQGGTGCFQLNNTSDKYPNGSSAGRLVFYNDNKWVGLWEIYMPNSGLNRVISSYSELSLKTANSVHIRIDNLGEARTLTIKPLFIENVTSQVPFIPYFTYKIPIKVQGKNLFNSSVEQGGLKALNGTEYTSGQYYTKRLRSDYINLTSNKTYTISSNMKIKMIIAYNENKYISCLLNTGENLLYSTITLPADANNIRIVFWSGTNDIAVEPSNFEWGQIEEGEVVTEYEEPFSSTNNIYLNRPLLKDGNDYDYIDYSEQKRYNYDGTIENITIQHVLTNNGMNTLTFDSLVQPLQSFIKYYDEDAETPIVDSSSSFEASFTTSGTQLLNYRIWGTDTGLGNTNLFDFDAWWETIKNNVHNGSVKRGKNQSFTITPTGADTYTSMASAVYSGGYRIYVEPNSSYTWSWNKECTNNAYYGRQMIFLDGRSETGYMFSCTGSTSLTFTTKSDTSFIMLRFGCGINTDTPITFSNITLSKNNSNPNILINMSDMNDISTWDINLSPLSSNTVETNSWVAGQVIDVTNINSLYIVGDLKMVYNNNLRIGKSNNPITSGSSISFTDFRVLPQIIDTSDCNYILISVNRYNTNTTVEQIKNTFKIYKAQPNTSIITLPRRIFNTDTNIEYIDYESQKLYSTNNVNTDISLPPISTVVGKNKLRIPPDKKPSKLMIKYLI